MGEGVQDYVDPHGVGVGREEEEELVVLSFTLPPVGDVRVVGHHDQKASVLVGDSTEGGCGALRPPFRGVQSAGSIPVLDGGDLGDAVHRVQRVEQDVVLGYRADRVFGEDRVDLPGPHLPGEVPPEVVDPQEAPLQEVVPQGVLFFRGESHRPHVRCEDEGAIEQVGLGGRHDGMER